MIGSEPRQFLEHYVETLVVGEIVRAFLAASISVWGVHAGLLQVQINDWPAADGPRIYLVGRESEITNLGSRD